MFAVIQTGGKQLKVAANDTVKVEKLAGDAGSKVQFTSVLMLGGESVQLGAPMVEGAVVSGQIVEQTRGDKVIAFKKRRRQNSRRKVGHRQHITVVRITEIALGGKVLAKGEEVKIEAAPVAEKAPKVAAKKAESAEKAPKAEKSTKTETKAKAPAKAKKTEE